MAKNFMRKYAVSAKGILGMNDTGTMFIEDTESGETFYLNELLEDFADKIVKISVTYDEEYGYGAEL